MKKIILLFILSLYFLGCATPKYNYAPLFTKASKPSLDSIVKAYVGEPMLQQAKYSVYDAIFLPEDIKWIKFKPRARMLVLDRIFPEGIPIPEYFIDNQDFEGLIDDWLKFPKVFPS